MIAGVIVSYLLGNISPATIMGRIYGVDIRKAGSGNPGTTNTLREIGPKAAAVTLLIDILKGVAGAAIGYALSPGGLWMYVCGTAVFLGHIWPVFYRFKGGKGIATGFGVMLFIDWRLALCLLITAGVGAFISKRMSIGSVAAAVAVPILFGITRGPGFAVWGAAIGLIIIWRHRGNIQRIIRHEEPKISFLDKDNKSKKEKSRDSSADVKSAPATEDMNTISYTDDPDPSDQAADEGNEVSRKDKNRDDK